VVPQVRRGEQEPLRELVLNGQSPGFDVLVAAVEALQRARMICSAGRTREIGDGLLISRNERERIGLSGDERGAKSITFQASIEVIILGGATIDAEAGAHYGFAVQGGRRPGEARAGINVSVIRGV
jgi:hypothetical protein